MEKIKEYVKNEYLLAKRHPFLPITSYCYTQKAEIEEKWDNITLYNRGTIYDDNGRIIFNSAKKFFNKDQNQIAKNTLSNILNNNYLVLDKLDGSFIKIVNDKKYGLIIGSKTSFENEYTAWAKEIIKENNYSFEEGVCYHFELIVPENRIVVNYKNKRQLVLWAAITQSGDELNIFDNRFNNFIKPKIISNIEKYLNKSNIEGVVLSYKDNRIKIKTEEYLKIHKVRTTYSKKQIIKLLEEGKSIKDFKFPDEFIKDLIQTENCILFRFNQIKKWAMKWSEMVFEILKMSPKALALNTSLNLTKEQKVLLFTIKNGANDKLDKIIWKIIKKEEKEERLKNKI